MAYDELRDYEDGDYMPDIDSLCGLCRRRLQSLQEYINGFCEQCQVARAERKDT